MIRRLFNCASYFARSRKMFLYSILLCLMLTRISGVASDIPDEKSDTVNKVDPGASTDQTEEKGNVIVEDKSQNVAASGEDIGTTQSEAEAGGTPEDLKIDSDLELYKKLFQQKRKSHLDAVKSILTLEKYEKQYKMVKMVLEKLFSVLSKVKESLLQHGYTPGDPFPKDETVREMLSNIVENVAFFGDLLLRMPDMTDDIMRRNNEWVLLAKWGVIFSNETSIFQGNDLKLLNLMAQEMGLVEKDPNYVNPYRESSHEDKLEKELKQLIKKDKEDTKKNKKPKKEKKKKGPRLSGVVHTDL